MFAPKYISPCFKIQPNYGPDGCAIFYNKKIFSLINYSTEKIVINGEVNSQVFLILELLHSETKSKITVLSLHLKSDRDSSHQELRALQIKEVLKSVKTHIKRNDSKYDFASHKLFLCGDFNGSKDEEFNELIKSDPDFISLVDAYTDENDDKCATLIRFKGPDKPMFKKDLDYIYYNKSSSKLTQFLELPNNDELTNTFGLPNLKYASDHFSLVADFQIN